MSGKEPYISDETLFGYLIHALPSDELDRIEQLALAYPHIQQRIEDLKCLIEPVDASKDEFEPRVGLASDTMAKIEAAAQELAQSKCVLSPPLTWGNSDETTRIAWGDSLVALTASMIILSVLLPTIWQWRESARKIACSENLRQLGSAFLSFTKLDGRNRLPRIDREGPLSFAGVYAIRLKDSGLLDSPSWLWCPSNNYLEVTNSVPGTRSFLEADPMQQRIWRYSVGGNYAYTLGYLSEDGRYETPRFGQQKAFALIGDMWPENYGNVNITKSMVLHGKNGANVMYDDGHIQLVRVGNTSSDRLVDNPFLNRRFVQAVGMDQNDSCLGPSYWLPFAECESYEE